MVSLEPACDAKGTVTVLVRNLGEAPLTRGVAVEIVTSSGTLLGTVTFSRVLGPSSDRGHRVRS